MKIRLPTRDRESLTVFVAVILYSIIVHSGDSESITITNAKGRLSKDDIDRMIQEAEVPLTYATFSNFLSRSLVAKRESTRMRLLRGGGILSGVGRKALKILSLSTFSHLPSELRPLVTSPSTFSMACLPGVVKYSGLENRCNVWTFWIDCDAVLDRMEITPSTGGVE